MFEGMASPARKGLDGKLSLQPQGRQPATNTAAGMRRSISLQADPGRKIGTRTGGRNAGWGNLAAAASSGGKNATWGASPQASMAANTMNLQQRTHALLQVEGRRGNNGLNLGQTLLNIPAPVLLASINTPAAVVVGNHQPTVRIEPPTFNREHMTTQEGFERVSDAALSDTRQRVPSTMTRPVRKSRRQRSRIYDDPAVVAGYASVPLMELNRLPRGGISLETRAVGRIQFGIPPETIKDSMLLGFGVPSVYIVPVERFCREMGPALGINLAEFEFPAYFNYFVREKRCTLVVDSMDAEQNIRAVFSETLLGPVQFRNHDEPTPNEDEDFDPTFAKEARPNFYKEFYHFRTAEASSNYQELTIDMLLDFCHFKGSQQGRGAPRVHEKLGVPPTPIDFLPMDDVTEEMEESLSGRRHVTLMHPEDELSGCGDGLDDSYKNLTPGEEPGSGSGSGDHDDDSLCSEPSRPIRRTMSNPDMRKNSLDDMMQISVPPSPGVDSSLQAGPDPPKRLPRRGSMDSTGSFISKGGRSRDGMSWASGASFMLASDDEDDPSRNSWMYSQAKWLGEVATVYPSTATDEQKRSNETPRVEIFKMTGGTEYIVHDIDDNNIIVGKARFSGTVRVPDEMAVEGFLAKDNDDDRIASASRKSHGGDSDVEDEDSDPGSGDEGEADNASDHPDYQMQQDIQFNVPRPVIPPTFHPPSFGVTVLGNSHGFDKNGSTSGYVLWINGRGVMIDPPPYSSATLEREGIRPQMIMAIIITHCHADHDAGTFQKVMTGSRVAIITTPTIYKSFIRKYAALSGLSPTLLRHSHRHRPAIVGQPLKFQGAKFHFTYTLHTIPCIAFKVEWRGRSMVFTGDHLNSPPMIENLEKMGVLAKERADDLRRLPLQECDALLHEAGAPPIHTPLSVLKELPERVKRRLYVVHTSALPPDCGLRVAPTGTAGTIRLDELNTTRPHGQSSRSNVKVSNRVRKTTLNGQGLTHVEDSASVSVQDDSTNDGNIGTLVDGGCESMVATKKSRYPGGYERRRSGDVYGIDPASLDDGGCPNLTVLDEYGGQASYWRKDGQKMPLTGPGKLPPLVFLRPTCVSDAWFILNLLSAVPFLSSLSYANTMEVLEIAQVEMFCANEIIIPAPRRSEVLCVVWEGTCVEREPHVAGDVVSIVDYAVGYDRIHGRSTESDLNNVVYVNSGDGLLRRFNPTIWHAGDWTGPVALQPDTERSAEVSNGEGPKDIVALSAEGVKVIMLNMKDLHQILKSGSKLFRKYLALKEKQAAEEAAMKAQMMRNEIMIQGDYNYVVNNGDAYRIDPVAEQVPNHWYAYDSVLEVLKCNSALARLTALQKRHLESLAEGPRFFEAGHYLWQVGEPVDYAFLIVAGMATFSSKPEDEWRNRRSSTGNLIPVQQTGDRLRLDTAPLIEEDKQLFNVPPNSEYARLEIGLQLRVEEMELDVYDQSKDLLPKEERMRNARDRFANKVLARLYSRRAYTAGLVFSRGHLLSDTSRMVSGNLAHIHHTGRHETMSSIGHGLSGDHHCHTSNMVAGPDGCVVMIFPRSSLVQFLDGNPGVLLSLLGTQVVV